MAKTLYEKVFDAHVVYEGKNELPILYIDRHLIHEVTSPQAFSGLKMAKRRMARADLTLATIDHDVSTKSVDLNACSDMAKEQITTLMQNTKEFGVRLLGLGDKNQGIVHIVGPELGFTLPGVTLVCGDSHTATHGAFGALAFGIGTSEVEHVMATQTLKQAKLKTMKIECKGQFQKGVYAKDLILYLIAQYGTAKGTGYAIEFCGELIRNLSMEARMTLCNMAIEFGAKVGMIAPDEITFEYIKGKEFAPKGEEFQNDNAKKEQEWIRGYSEVEFGLIQAVILLVYILLVYISFAVYSLLGTIILALMIVYLYIRRKHFSWLKNKGWIVSEFDVLANIIIENHLDSCDEKKCKSKTKKCCRKLLESVYNVIYVVLIIIFIIFLVYSIFFRTPYAVGFFNKSYNIGKHHANWYLVFKISNYPFLQKIEIKNIYYYYVLSFTIKNCISLQSIQIGLMGSDYSYNLYYSSFVIRSIELILNI